MMRRAILLGLVALLIAGCGARPAVSDVSGWNEATRAEQQQWIEVELNEAIAHVGPSVGWAGANPDKSWPAQSRSILRSARQINCQPSKGSDQPGKASVTLLHDSHDDPMAAVKQLYELWDEPGWRIEVVMGALEATDHTRLMIRAKGEHGTMKLAEATSTFLYLTVDSACSSDPTARS